jgi:hypothetical protein
MTGIFPGVHTAHTPVDQSSRHRSTGGRPSSVCFSVAITRLEPEL